MTDEQLVELAKNEAGWEKLHALCLERSTAERFARALEQRAPQMAYEATVWAAVLKEMHPDLIVRLSAKSADEDSRGGR